MDKNAIVMNNQNGQKVGYVPRQDNVVFQDLWMLVKNFLVKLQM